MNAVNPLPVLAPPGAGLPCLEFWIMRLIFAVAWRPLSRAKIENSLHREHDVILALAKSCPDETASERRLIKRLRGIEDSSRFWSVYMTLDHLHIVNRVGTMTIRGLAKGHAPKAAASTARVKPSPEADASALQHFTQSVEDLVNDTRAIPELRTAQRYAHPWFGPMDAAGWFAMLAMHMNLHRRQIERILETKV